MVGNLVTRRGGAILSGLKSGLVDAIFPPRCLVCTEATEAARGLCASCWRETHFIAGAACAKCGVPLIGEAAPGDLCDGCERRPPAWDRGRAAVVYTGTGRKAVLALKHSDRLDVAGPLAGWMAAAGGALLAEADLIAPVPLHWRRLIRRRYNQSAELARHVGRASGRPVVADLLRRVRQTVPQERMDHDARYSNQAGAIAMNPRHATLVEGRGVLLVDDVMTSGATLSACTEACRAAGASRVDVLVLARVAFRESGD
jgi:predicted amidophosphoribosyltransferase